MTHMDEKLTINVQISITRDAYRILERLFLGGKNESLEKELFARQQQYGNIDHCQIPAQPIQEFFDAGIRVLDAVSPVFERHQEGLIKKYEETLTQLRLPSGFPPF